MSASCLSSRAEREPASLPRSAWLAFSANCVCAYAASDPSSPLSAFCAMRVYQTGSMDPAGPAGPALPRGPIDPAGPMAPVSPFAPGDPAGPMAPRDPASPRGPLDPAGPMAPVSPFAPDEPGGPGGPADPAGPAGMVLMSSRSLSMPVWMSFILELLFPMPTARKLPVACSSLSFAKNTAFREKTSCLKDWKSVFETSALAFTPPATGPLVVSVVACGDNTGLVL